MSDVGQLKDAHALQYNVVHVNRQRSVYLPVMKQGGDSNTIAVVDGVRKTVSHLVDVPPAMKTTVVFDQSRFVRTAIETLLHEGGIGLFLTCLMILMFLGSLKRLRQCSFPSPYPFARHSSFYNWADRPSTAWCWVGWRWRCRG